MSVNNHGINNLINKIIIVFLQYGLLIDCLNGFILRGTSLNVSIAQPIKIFILALMLGIIIEKSKEKISLLIWLFIFALFSFIHFAYNSTGSPSFSLGYDISLIIKPLYIVIIYIYLLSNVDDRTINENKIYKIIDTNLLVLIVNQSVGMLGYGYPAYTVGDNVGIGTRGFFYAGNELSLTFLVLTGMYLFKIDKPGNRIKYLISSMVFIFLSFTLASKTAIISTIIMAFYFPAIKRPVSFLKYGTVILLLLVFFISWQWETIKQIPSLGRFLWIMENLGVKGFVFSNRDTWLAEGITNFKNDYTVTEQLIGVGKSRLEFEIGRMSEIDYFDMIFLYGIIGSILILLPFFYLLIRPFFFRHISPYGSLLLINLLILLLAFFSGHVVYSVAAAPYIASLIALEKIRSQ